MKTLGQTFLTQTIDNQSIRDNDNLERQVIDIQSLIIILRYLGF
jgi:hypothetical protein